MKKLTILYLFVSLMTVTQPLFCMQESITFTDKELNLLSYANWVAYRYQGDDKDSQINRTTFSVTEITNANTTINRCLRDFDACQRQRRFTLTGLIHAASFGLDNILHSLLMLRYNSNERANNNDGTTPLVLAAFWKNFDCCALLLAYEADPMLTTSKGLTPLSLTEYTNSSKEYQATNHHGLKISQEHRVIVSLFRWWIHVQDKENRETVQEFKSWLKIESNRKALKHWLKVQDKNLNPTIISNLTDWWTDAKNYNINDASFHDWIAIPGNMQHLYAWWINKNREYEPYPIRCEQREANGAWHAVISPTSQAAAATASF